MYRFFYDGLKIPHLLLLLVMGIIIWGWLKSTFKNNHPVIWRIGHAGIALVWILLFAYIVLFSRDQQESELILTPFWSYKLAFIDGSFDFFQEIYLNIFLFVFFSIPASEIVDRRWWKIFVALSGLAISICAEYLQYRYGLGLAETDDVISNFTGTAIGILIGVFAPIISEKVRKAFKKWIKKG